MSEAISSLGNDIIMVLNDKNLAPVLVTSEIPGTGEIRNRPHTYGQILKSSALIGGSSVVNIALGIIRTKAMAVLLGPAGVGLFGLFNSITDLAQTMAGMGINSSGVRQIAEAVGSGETERIARTATVLKRVSVILGLAGALLLVVFSRPVSTLTFGNDQHRGDVVLLSLVVLFGSITAGQSALIQGMRRIMDLARMGVLGALFGTLVSIPLVYFLGENGVVPSLVAVAGAAMITSWWYSRKVQIPPCALTTPQVRQEVAALLRLGVAFMASGLLTMGAAYVIRIILIRKLGLQSAGLYQSAWVLGGLYVGFILQAMAADFYPRLTANAKDNHECNHLVNEQAQVSLLLAGTGVMATLTLAPLVMVLFYSAKFEAAVGILRWICLGMTLRVVAWPMGFIVLAKGAQRIFFWTEVAAALVHVGLAWLLISSFGLVGAGAAFFGLYVWHGLLIYLVVRRLTGFRWSAPNRQIGMVFLPLTGLVFCGFYLLPFPVAITLGMLATCFSSIYSVRFLLKVVSPERIPRPLRRLLVWFRFAPSDIL